MKYTKLEKVSAWRKLSVGMWGPHNSPMAQGMREVDLSKTLPYLERVRAETGKKVTITHIFVAAVGRMFREYPQYNVILRRNRPYLRPSVDCFVQVAVKAEDGSADLSGVKIRGVDSASLIDIYDQVARRAEKVRAGKDQDIESAKSTLNVVPPLLTPWLMKAVSTLTYDLGVDLTRFGIKPDPFGSSMVTNVGAFGIPHALVPLLPTSKVPSLYCLGAIHDRPRAVNGKVKVVPSLILTGSFDHRLYDGFQIGKMTTYVDQVASDPEAYDLFELKNPKAKLATA